MDIKISLDFRIVCSMMNAWCPPLTSLSWCHPLLMSSSLDVLLSQASSHLQNSTSHKAVFSSPSSYISFLSVTFPGSQPYSPSSSSQTSLSFDRTTTTTTRYVAHFPFIFQLLPFYLLPPSVHIFIFLLQTSLPLWCDLTTTTTTTTTAQNVGQCGGISHTFETFLLYLSSLSFLLCLHTFLLHLPKLPRHLDLLEQQQQQQQHTMWVSAEGYHIHSRLACGVHCNVEAFELVKYS